MVGKNLDVTYSYKSNPNLNKRILIIDCLRLSSFKNKVLDYFVSSKPGLCIHFEPIHEVLDPDNLLDYLTMQYFNKRNYLKNYLTSLQKLEREGKIRILDVRRLYYGSKFIEGHTVIIWKPV